MNPNLFWKAIVTALACIAGTPAFSKADCTQWVVGPGQQSAGPNGAANAAIQWDSDAAGPLPAILVTGGSFSVAGTSLVNNIASWDGTNWAPMGSGFNGSVRALTTYNNQLIAAGRFTASGGTSCNRIARWTGTSWQPLGSGITGGTFDEVYCLAVFNGRLYAGGSFTNAGGVSVQSIANWDGSVWRSLGPAGGGVQPGRRVNSMLVFAGKLTIGGDFEYAGSLANTRALVQWDGTAWSGLGAFPDTSFGNYVYCLGATTFVAGQGENLYMGGSFSTVGGVSAPNIAKYNTLTGAWSSVSGGLGATCLQMMVFQFGGIHSVTVSRSSLNGAGGGTYRYTTTTGVWNLLSPQTANCYSIALSGYLLGGVNGVSELIGADWMPLGNGLNGPIRRMVSIGSDLYAAGSFTVADQHIANGVARFDGAQWNALGAGPGLTSVQTAAVYNGQLVVGGVVGTSPQVARVTRWDGAVWTTMGTLTGSYFELLVVLDGSLYAVAAGSVYRWNGLGWQAMGSGAVHINTMFGTPDTVSSLVSRSGVLYAASAGILYSLQGSVWIAIAGSPPGYLDRWINLNGTLVGASSVEGGPIYRWLEPGSETLLSSSTGNSVVALAENGGVLHAQVSNLLARLDGSQWTVLGTFAGGGPTDILFRNAEIIVSGNVGTVDNIVSPMWARRALSPSADYNGSGTVSVQDIFDFLADYFAGAPCADFNGSGTRTVQDLFDFLSAYFAA